MIFKLDYETIYIFYALITLVNAYSLSLMWFEHRSRYKGLFHWVLYFLFKMTAYLLFLSTSIQDPLIFKLLPHEVKIVALIYLSFGFQYFLKIQKRCYMAILFSVLHFLVLSYFTFIVDSLQYRLIFTTLTTIIVNVVLLIYIYRNTSVAQRNVAKPALVVVMFMIQAHIFRLIVLLTQDISSKDIFVQPYWVGLTEVITILLSIVMVVNLTRIVDRQLQHDIREQEKKFNLTFQVSPHAIALIDRTKLSFVEINQTFTQMFGYTKVEVIGKQTQDVHLEDLGIHIMDFMNQTHLSQAHSLEMVLFHKDGSKKQVQVNFVLDKLSGKEVIISTIEDISEIMRLSTKMAKLANYDALTELPNRYLLKERFERAVENADRNHTLMALVVLDIDDFKDYNDEFGHAFGDKVLIAVSKKTSKLIRKVDTLARFGGDEFIILLCNLTSADDVLIFAQRLLALFKTTFKIDGQSTVIHVSAGAVIYPESGQSLDILLKRADGAMYQVKNSTKAGFKLYR